MAGACGGIIGILLLFTVISEGPYGFEKDNDERDIVGTAVWLLLGVPFIRLRVWIFQAALIDKRS